MTEGYRAGWWAIVYLLMVGAAAYFTMFMIIFSFVKKLFLFVICFIPIKKEIVKSFAAILKTTMLLGRFAPIFFSNCEHVSLCTLKQKQKKVCGFHEKISCILKIY